MHIGISDAATYCSIGPVWVILCFIITVLYCDVPMGIYCYISRYPFPLENADIRFRLYIYIYNK